MNKPLFLLAIALDLACVALLLPFMDQYLELVGLDKNKLGLVQSIYGALQSISLPIAGSLAETVGRRPLLLLSMVGTPFSYGIKMVALFLHSAPLFIISRIITGATRHTMTSGSAIMLDEAGLDLEKRAANLASLQSAASLGFVIAPAIGGLVMERFGAVTLAGVSVMTGFTSAIIATYATRPSAMKKEIEQPQQQQQEGEESNNESKKRSSSSSSKSKKSSKKKKSVSSPSTNDDALVERATSLSAPRADGTKTSFADLIHIVRTVLVDRGETRWLTLAIVANSVAFVCIQSYTSFFLKNAFDFRPSLIGITISMSSALVAISQFGIGQVLKNHLLPVTPRTLLLILSVICSLGNCIIAVSSSMFHRSSAMYIVGLVLLSLTSGAVDAMSKSTLSMYFGDKNAIAMALCFSVDGANRVLMPLTTSWLLANNYSVAAPMVVAATAALISSFSHVMGPTAKKIKLD